MDSGEIEKTGRIIYCGRELEGALRRYGATGVGLGDLTASVRKQLPESMLRDIHYVIGVRNHVAHDPSGVPSAVDMETFEAISANLLRGLEELTRAKDAYAEKRYNADREAPPPEVEEMEEWKREFRSRLKLMACIPLLNWVFFAVLAVTGVWKSLKYVLAVILQLLALPLFYGGYYHQENIYWVAGFGLAVGAYVWGILLLMELQPRPGWWWWAPVLNGFRLTGEAFRRINWPRLLVGLAGVGLDLWAVYCLWRQEWRNMLIGMALAYVIGLGAVVIWGRPMPEKDE